MSSFYIFFDEFKNVVFDFSNFVKLGFYALFVWLKIDLEVFSILMVFMSVDSVLGAVKAVRLGEDFSFKKLLWGFCLKLCFLIIPLMVALLAKGMGEDFELGVDIVMKILIVSEAYSGFGNIYSIKNKVEVKRIDIISMLLKSMRIGLKKVLDKTLSTIENASDCKIKNDK